MTGVIAIDVGTSAVRVAIVSVDGAVERSARIERDSRHSGIIFDAGELWMDVCAALTSLKASEVDDLRGLAVSCHIGTVFTDDALTPLGDAGGWADTRGVDLLSQRYSNGLEHLLQLTGRPAVTGGQLAALLHLRDRLPDLYARTRWLLSPKDFLVAKLTGVISTDHTSAAYTMLSSVKDREWSAQILHELDVPRGLLPSQFLATDVIGRVTGRAAARTGVPVGTPVACGGPDGTLGATAALGRDNSAIVDIAGTTDVLVQLTDELAGIPAAAVVNPFTVRDVWSLGGATGMTGGSLSRWSSILGFSNADEALQRHAGQLASIPPGAEGLLMQPMLSGSRFPTWDPSERGHVWGMSDHHSAAHILRAALEGAAFVVREGVEALTPGGGDEPILLAGGVAKSQDAAQLRADVLGRPVIVCDWEDASLLGAALAALVGSGLHSSMLEPLFGRSETVRRHEPDESRTARYDALFRDWKAMRAASRA